MATAGDRDNFSGDISFTTPTGGYTKGSVYLIGDAYFVARETKTVGQPCIMASLVSGAVWATKAAGTGKTMAVGEEVFVKANVLENATSSGAVILPAFVLRAAAASDTKVLIAGGGLSPTQS